MGIKGIFSLINSEPTRFGRPWIVSSEEDECTVIIIDGPAFHHHLLLSWLDKSAHTIGNQHQRYKLPVDSPVLSDELTKSAPTTCSSSTLYKLAHSFLSTLFISGANEIHVVWDGLASPWKREVQLERIDQECHNCYQAAQYFTNTTGTCHHSSELKPTLHIWGESIIEQAIYDIQSLIDRPRENKILLNHRAQGEAELYIAQLCNRFQSMHHIGVLSNDTDLFVYNSIPGFIPFTTLIFEVATATNNQHRATQRVKGWMYTKFQFHMAYPFLQPIGSSIQDNKQHLFCNFDMIAIGAIAGCDYKLNQEQDASLYKVRKAIISSDVGGLRLRERNNPSKKNALVAILRFMGHINKSLQLDENQCLHRNDYMSILGTAILSTKLLREKYWNKCTDCSLKRSNKNKNDSSGNQFPSLFIQALLEIGRIYDSETDPMSMCSYPIQCADVHLRRIRYHHVFYCKPLIELQPSIWQSNIFSSCRRRMYAAIAFLSENNAGFHFITEYVHVRQGPRNLYLSITVDFSREMNLIEYVGSNSVNPNFMAMLGFVLGSSMMYASAQDALPGAASLSFYACTLLNSCDMKFLLLAITFIALIFTEKWLLLSLSTNANHTEVSTDDKIIFLNIYNSLQVALFHANLAHSSLKALLSHNNGSISSSRILSDELLTMLLWKRISGSRTRWTYCESSRDLIFEIICQVTKSPTDCEPRITFCNWWEIFFHTYYTSEAVV